MPRGGGGPIIAQPPRNNLSPLRFSEGDAGAKRQQGMHGASPPKPNTLWQHLYIPSPLMGEG